MTSPKQSNYFQKMRFGQMGQKKSDSKPFRIPQKFCRHMLLSKNLDTKSSRAKKNSSNVKHFHTTNSWNIKWQKCADVGFNDFIFKKWKLKYLNQKTSWEPFRSCLLNSTANPANFHPNWARLAFPY